MLTPHPTERENKSDTQATQASQREDVLLKAGALQNAIFNSANFSSIATDERGVIQIFNVGAERMLGYKAVDVVNKITPAEISDPLEVIARAKALSEELHTKIAPGFEALVFKASRGIEDVYELTYIRKDGSHFPAVVSVTALRDNNNGIIGFLLIGTDNTARKRAEEALLKAGALQNAIFRSAYFSCIATDEKGVIQLFNVGAERMLGYTAAEVLNKITPADLHDPQEVIERAKALTLELGISITPGFEALAFKAARGIEDIYELTKIRKDGSRFPAVVSVTALRDGQNRIIGYLLIGTDNTMRQQVEEERKKALHGLNDMKEALNEHALVAITDSQGTITYVNDKFCVISQYSREELLGKDHRIINSGYHSKEFFRDLWTTIARGEAWHGEIKNRAKDGSTYWVETTIVPFLDEQGKPRQYMAIRADITERKLAQEATAQMATKIHQLNAELEGRVVERTEELEIANKELEAFSYSVSHDLRAPLRAVDGFSQAVLEDYGPLLPPDGQHYLKTIREGAQQMGKLIDDLLAFSRLSRAPINKQTVNTGKLVRSVLEDLNSEREGRQIELQVDELPTCLADPALLKQVWINLLSNAIKYTRQRTPAKIQIGCKLGRENVYFVRDNGAGFDMRYVHKLFGVFQRLHRSDQFEGTGVGLAIVQRIIHRHGGRVWVEAAVNSGATFYFNLKEESKL